MKKLFILIFAVVLFTSCGFSTIEKQERTDDTSMFVLVEKANSWYIVYHRETKVMYAVSANSNNFGTFTLLVDKDGKPLLYRGN